MALWKAGKALGRRRTVRARGRKTRQKAMGTPLTRSEIMSRIRSKDTVPEVLTRSAVHALGIRFRTHVPDLPGKPDLANKKRKWAIFVHGCFWHSHDGCRLASSPKSNTGYWIPKLMRNQERDREKTEALRDLGYRVLVVWECQARKSADLTKVLAEFFPSAAGK